MPSQRPFRAIVVGGGVAGLTLANMFERFGLDYVLLEAHDDPAPATGAAIGILVSGSSILDQAGCYDGIRASAPCAEIVDTQFRDSDGKVLLGVRDVMYHETRRHGYPMIFLNRQWFLRGLYDQLKHKERIHLSCRMDRIQPVEGGVQVTTKDGKSFTGDIVVGADGVHSSVRREMRRIADATAPGYFDPGEEDKVACHYQCSFGIAQGVDGWLANQHYFTTNRGKSSTVVSGPGDRCYWFLFVKLPEVKYGKQIPRYSKEDETRFFEEHKDFRISENVTFAQIYSKRLSSALTPIHEILYKKWFFGRMFLVGDSAHKPSPVNGMGGNGAIETAAEFMNGLMDVKAERRNGLDGLTSDEIKTIFTRVQEARFERASTAIKGAHDFQALQAHEDPLFSRLVLRVLMPLAGEFGAVRGFSGRAVRAPRLRHVDLPGRPHVIPWDYELPAKPLGPLPTRVAWGLFSLAMALLIYTGNYAINRSHGELGSWDELAPLNRKWLSTTATDHGWKSPTSLFSFSTLDSHLAPRIQLVYSMVQMLSPLLLYTVEGYRMGRRGTILSLPIVFMIAMQMKGIGKVAPVYSLLSAFLSYQNPMYRPVSVDVARSLLPALLLGFIIPTTLISTPSSNETRWQDWIQVSPPLFSVLTAAFSTVLGWRRKKSEEPPAKHPEWYSTDDAPILKFTYDFAFVAQAVAHVSILAYTYFRPDISPSDVFWNVPNPFECESYSSTSSEEVSLVLKYDLILTVIAVASHNLYAVWELRRQGYISTSKAMKAALAVVLGQAFVGSGATWAYLWSWREDVILGLSVPDRGKKASR